MFGRFDNIRIQGISSAVPSTIERNEIYANVLGERRVKKQIKLTGVEQRHISDRNQRASDLCYAAAVRMIDHLDWKPEEIKVMLFVTQSPDFSIPSTAFLLHKRLGLPQDCVCFDINLGCTAFNVGIQTIGSMLQPAEIGTKALLLIGDTIGIKSPYYACGPDEVAKLMLFGSAGTCVAVEKVENEVMLFENKSDGERYKAIYGEFGLPSRMDGSAVFSFAVNDVAESIRSFRDKCGISEEYIDYYAFHQAQKLILDDICESCEIAAEKELRSYDQYGNTSGASVLVSLCANAEKLERKAIKRFLLTGFGVGLSWGCIYTSINTEGILPVFEYDDSYEFRPESRGLHGVKIELRGGKEELREWICRFLIGQDAEIIKPEAVSEHSPDYLIVLDVNRNSNKELKDVLDQTVDKEDGRKPALILCADSAEENGMIDMGSVLKNCFNYADNLGYDCSHGMIYDSSLMEVIPIRDNGQEWFERYVDSNCPISMIKASDLARSIEMLIWNSNIYDNHTILGIK